MLTNRKSKDEGDILEACDVTMDSVLLSGHTHTCSGKHLDGGHMCSAPNCRRWFWKKGTRV